MAQTILERAWAPFADLEIRSDGDGRTVYGIAVPFDEPTPIREHGREFTEVFKQGAFAKTINDGAQRVKFLMNHDRQSAPLGRAVSLVEDPTGLVGEFRVSKTQAGDEALELIRDGVLDAFSVGFRPIRDKWNRARDFVERIEVALPEVSTVSFPAYSGALVSGVRQDDGAGSHLHDDADPGQGHLDVDAAGDMATAAMSEQRRRALRIALALHRVKGESA